VNCHRNTFELKENEKLTICDHCKLVHHCTACNISVSIHEAECPKLQEVTAAELFAIQHYLLTGEITVQKPTEKPREMYIPLSTAESWYDYFTKISDKTMATGLLSHDLKPLAGNDEWHWLCALALEELAVCSQLSQPLKSSSESHLLQSVPSTSILSGPIPWSLNHSC